jgi:hypothetical protein
MKPTNFPVGEANRGPKWARGKKPQIPVKSISRIKVWDLHEEPPRRSGGSRRDLHRPDLRDRFEGMGGRVGLKQSDPGGRANHKTQSSTGSEKRGKNRYRESDPNDKDELHEHN